jgi:hypothetical protein
MRKCRGFSLSPYLHDLEACRQRHHLRHLRNSAAQRHLHAEACSPRRIAPNRLKAVCPCTHMCARILARAHTQPSMQARRRSNGTQRLTRTRRRRWGLPSCPRTVLPQASTCTHRSDNALLCCAWLRRAHCANRAKPLEAVTQLTRSVRAIDHCSTVDATLRAVCCAACRWYTMADGY